jgi:hypothetical protein
MASILTLLGFKQAIEEVRGAKSIPRLVEWIDAARIKDDPQPELVDGKEFEAGDCYFGLRLAGLHLKDSRRFAQQLLPLCICLAEFKQGGKPQAVPFSLGPDTIRQRLQAAQPVSGTKDDAQPRPGWVELRDIEIVRPTPMSQANVAAFIGLYSVPGDDIARTLLNVMGTISQACGGALSPAMGVAEKVYDGFTTLLGVRGVTPEVEALHGSLLKKSGYLLVSNADENSPLKSKLLVSGGRLRDSNSSQVTDFDYCLLGVQRHETLIEATNTAPDLFGTYWSEVIEAFDDSAEAAGKAFKRLQRIVYGSTDLIARDRDALIAGYLLEYKKAAEVLAPAAEAAVKSKGPGGSDKILGVAAKFPPLYAALVEKQKPEIELDRSLFGSGANAWTRAARLRPEFIKLPPGAVADAIMNAL